ncbi:TrxB Thioredoxin reductase [Fimbriimonadaceae bacterium]
MENVIIIGSGPAGYTAALYAARADLKPLLFAGWQPGGQLMITTDVENYPGFPKGIMGPEIMELFREQAARFGTDIRDINVDKVDLTGPTFKVWVGEELHEAKSIIICTGASAKWLGLEGEVTFGGYGVSACATCDGFFFRNKKVAIVGGGDTAMEEALFLTRHASEVHVLHRRDSFRASKIMQERVLEHPKIKIHWNTAVTEIHGEMEPHKKLKSITLQDTVTSDIRQMEVDGLFIAIGHQPNSSLFTGVLDMDEAGYLITMPDSTRTKIPGVFAAGDVQDSVYRQAITAAGSGCMAAIEAERFLAGLH